MTDPQLWGATFGGPSWAGWRAFVAATAGLTLDGKGLALYQRCTGRQNAPTSAAKVIAALCGRRSGKSLTAAFMACAVAVLSQPKLAPGEKPIVLVCATDKKQAGVIHGYVGGLLDASPLTAREVVNRTAERIELRSGVCIDVRAADFRKVRGPTYLACLVDEAAFLRDEHSATPDLELYRALRPGLATTGGPSIAISSPWSRRGLLFSLWRKHWGKDASDTLVWVADSRTMNPTLDAEVIEEALADDPVAARSEWLGAWREDVEPFLSEAMLDAVTSERSGDLPPVPGKKEHPTMAPRELALLAGQKRPDLRGQAYGRRVPGTGGNGEKAEFTDAGTEVDRLVFAECQRQGLDHDDERERMKAQSVVFKKRPELARALYDAEAPDTGVVELEEHKEMLAEFERRVAEELREQDCAPSYENRSRAAASVRRRFPHLVPQYGGGSGRRG